VRSGSHDVRGNSDIRFCDEGSGQNVSSQGQ
jgi:hypothetical protein